MPPKKQPTQSVQPQAAKFQTTDVEPSPPQYRNPKFVTWIKNKKYLSGVSLADMKLTDPDMEIVAYYLIRNNTVRKVLTAIIMRSRSRAISSSVS